jgi:NitT/TauT family transport system permease protein
MKACVSIVVLLLFWSAISWLAGPALVPSPIETGRDMLALLGDAASWRHMLITFFRGVVGLALAVVIAFVAGVPCGLSKPTMNAIAPAVSAIQACPAIVWISLLMVWVGIGSVVPIAAIALSAFPVMFLNVAQGVAALDPRLFAMARVFKIPKVRVLRQIVLGGISSYALAGFSYALGICWKVTATAEFIGSSSGIGSQIYWSYRFLNMPRLFCWAILLIALGTSLEVGLIRPLRRRVDSERKSGND